MIKVDNIEVFNFEGAIRGMRNPLNSWHKSDSHKCHEDCPHVLLGTESAIECFYGSFDYCIGKNDLDLMQRLYKGGSEHRKYLRQIFVTMDINAPLYWWKEFDTYKVGTAANSTSTMHKIHAKEFTLDDFSHEHLQPFFEETLKVTIKDLNVARECYLDSKNKLLWWQMIQLLPSSYNQKRTVTMNYENVMNMIHQRENHKLDEWREFVKILRSLPYVMEIRGEK